MELYIPRDSFASQYPEWGAWPWSNFKKLPLPGETKTGGALLFVEGKINELCPLQDQPGFEARVTDDKDCGTSVWLTDDPLAPGFDCGCIRGRDGKPCVHAAGLIAALVYLFHEHNFIPLSPLLENVNALAADIDRSSRSEEDRPLRRLRLRKLRPGPAYLEGDAELPDPLVQNVNPYRGLSRMARNTLELPNAALREGLRFLIDFVRDANLTFEAERPEGGYLKLEPVVANVGTHLRFLADPQRDLVRAEPVHHSVDPEALLADLGQGVLVLRTGQIAFEDEGKFAPLQDALDGMERGFTRFDRDRGTYPLDCFNDYVARLDHASRRLYRQCEFAQVSDGAVIPEDPSTTRALTLKAALHIDHPKDGPHRQIAFLDGSVDDEFVALGGIFADFMQLLCLHAQNSDRLLGRRSRSDALLEAAAQLPRIGKQADRISYINSVVRRSDFRTRAQSKAATKFLRALERDYCRPKSAVAPMLFFDAKKRTYSWHLVRPPLPGLLALTATLYRHSNFQEILGCEYPMLPVNLRGEAFHQIAELCESFGIALRVDNEAALVRRAKISVDIAAGTKEDWFELRPSIRCEGFEIPAEQWEQLLQGTLFIESKDGGMLAPSLEDPEMLARLVETFNQGRKGEAGGKIHRLHVLDWLAWRKQGLELSLPPELETLFADLLHFDGIPELAPPPGLKAEMRPYQQRGFEWLVFLYRHRFGACLADDMGLGKTLQSLAFLAHLKSEAKGSLHTLAVLPPSLLYNWEAEAERFVPELTVATYAGTQRDPAVFENHDLVLSTYDIIRRDIDTLAKHPFDVVLFDEAQALKNHNSRRARAARRIDRRFTLCLTGTPMENHAGEFHSIMEVALPGLMGDRKAFDQALKESDETALRRSRPFLLRRTKAAILKELPPKVESNITLEMNEEQREIYTRIVGELREDVLTAFQKQSRG